MKTVNLKLEQIDKSMMQQIGSMKQEVMELKDTLQAFMTEFKNMAASMAASRQ